MTGPSPKFRHPPRWRETADPFSLSYHAFRPLEVLGYPHAGNDVFHVRGLYRGGERTAYVKAARQTGADAALRREAAILEQLDLPVVPEVLDVGDTPVPFLVTGELPGRRLSVLVEEKGDGAALPCMEEYGEMLGRLHALTPRAAPVADRRFFHRPPDALLDKLGLDWLRPFFARTVPATPVTVFCHGDFHYANVLWDARHISAVLDFELSGYGDRDFDIAWALILRPGQRFLRTEEELRRFLDGYRRRGCCDERAVRHYMAQIYVYFLEFSRNDGDYVDHVTRWLARHCGRR